MAWCCTGTNKQIAIKLSVIMVLTFWIIYCPPARQRPADKGLNQDNAEYHMPNINQPLNPDDIKTWSKDDTGSKPLGRYNQRLILSETQLDQNAFVLNETRDKIITPEITPNCPKVFQFEAEEDDWFRNNFEQISPFTENRNDNSTRFHEHILILTPISNVRNKLKHYFKLLCSLSYPHDKISIVLGEDSSHDQTLDEAKALKQILSPYFRRVDVLELQGGQFNSAGNARHDRTYQMLRRKHLAMCRNQILMRSLKDETLVLWLDSDVKHVPTDLIQHLMSANKAIIAANCLYRMSNGRMDVYDRNTWRETAASLKVLSEKSPDYLMLEGYGESRRKFLNDLKHEPSQKEIEQSDNNKVPESNPNDSTSSSKTITENNTVVRTAVSRNPNLRKDKRRLGDPVKLDGVGGCTLMVRAELHLRGLNFPPFIYQHHIETEGFAKMASQVYGAEIYGLPRVHIVHW